MIKLEQITKKFANTIAVDNLSLEIPKGQLCVLIGSSGCGKTTTLKMINRLIEPTSGTIFVDGIDSSLIEAHVLRRRMGYAIQSVGLLPHLTVGQNVAVVPNLLGWDKARVSARVTELLELVGLGHLEKALPNALSGGQAQRIGVARALAADPPMLLMDEPFGAVDPLTRRRLQNEFLILQRRLQKTVVLVTHDMSEALKLADRIVLLREGKIEQDGTPNDFLNAPASDFVRDFMGEGEEKVKR
jgi:osmoprotectant transport system ATP-binding protein